MNIIKYMDIEYHSSRPAPNNLLIIHYLSLRTMVVIDPLEYPLKIPNLSTLSTFPSYTSSIDPYSALLTNYPSINSNILTAFTNLTQY